MKLFLAMSKSIWYTIWTPLKTLDLSLYELMVKIARLHYNSSVQYIDQDVIAWLSEKVVQNMAEQNIAHITSSTNRINRHLL